MKNTKADDPAFPTYAEEVDAGYEERPGMTMREAYALHAPPMPPELMDPLLRQIKEKAGSDGIRAENLLAGCLAKWAFRYADAMLQEASQQKGR